MRTTTINPKYAYYEAFIRHIPDQMDEEGVYIYGGRRNLIKLFVAPDGTQFNVKRYKKPAFPSNWVYSLGLRQPKGKRAYNYPSILLERGIETPEAVAYIEDRKAGIIQHSWFISVQCPYRHLLYEMGDAPENVYAPLARALAAYVAHMHEHEVLHLDFSPGNVLWDIKESEEKSGGTDDYCFSIVDINRMRFGAVNMEDGCRSFARLWGPKHFMELLIREYARLRQFDPTAAERILMAERKRFWTHYQKKREMEFNLEL